MNSQRPQEGRERIDRMHRETIAQSKYARRIGEKVELPHADAHGIETWSIVDVVRQDDHAPVLLRSADGKRMMTIPALRLERYELAMHGRTASEPSSNVLAVADIPDEPKETIKERFSKRYAMVDYSDSVEQAASDDAEEALHREKAELKGVSGFFAKMLKHNIGYEITRQLELNRARTRIVSEKNIYANTGGTRAEHQAAIGAVLDRFIAEHDEFLHQEGNTGERRKVFGDSQAERAVKRELNALVRELATNPDMTEEEVDARRARIFQDANALAGEAKSRGLRYADNLREIAEEVRMAALHAGGLDNLDIDIDFAIGRAKLGARTEREKNLVDRTLERLERWGKDKQVVGGILAAFRNELAVAIASTVVIGNVLGRTALSSSAANVMTFGGAGAVTGLYSWWREKGRLNRERTLHERQMALGGDVNTELSQEQLDGLTARREVLTKQYQDTPLWRPLRRYELKKELDELYASEKPRRDEMQKFAMARANAKDLAYGGIGFLTPENTLRPDADPAIVMKALAEMEARVRISNAEKVDLLRYSSPMEAEIERRNLDATRMALKAALRAAVPDFQEEYNRILAETTTEFYGNEESGVRKTNEKFATYAQNRAKKVGIQTALIGAGIGYVAHEIWALASDNETVTGSIGRFASWLKEYVSGDTPLLPAGSPNVERIADGVFTTPHGTHLVPQADGSFAIETIADHKVIASGLFIGSDGTLDTASAETLRKLGASLVEADTFTSHSEIVTERVATWDWLHEHAPDVNQIKRDIWFGNDTPSPVFDFNEQGLDWGKVAGVNADGDFVMDMSSMTSDGSWQGLEEVDALAEMVNGKLRLVLTMNESSQNHAVEILFDEHGKAIIPADSDIARTFFAVKDGKAVFLGKYAEVAVSRGFDEKGVHHLGILATHIGKGLKEGVLTREIGECIPEHVTHITLPHSQPPTIIMPPILPLRPRTPLERLARHKGDGAFRGPLPLPTEQGGAYYDNYYVGEGSGIKTDRVEIARLRPGNSERITEETIKQCRELSAKKRGKYDFVLQRLEDLRGYDQLTAEKKKKIDNGLRAYNLRYFGSNTERYIGIDEYIGKQITRSRRQIENILLEESHVGDMPFPAEFYAESPLIRGIERAEEIVVVLEPSIGDTVLSVPIIHALDKYIQLHGMDKKIVVMTKNMKLLQGLEKQYAGQVEMISYQAAPARFAERKERYIVNVNARLQNYEVFGLTKDEGQSLEHVMSVEWSSWTKEEAPEKEGRIKKYDPIPYRIMRNFELMLGEKLFEDLGKVDHFIEQSPQFSEQERMLRQKYNILPGEKVIAITHGSQVKPKEYHPDQWREVVKQIFAKYPDAHILWLESPEAAKRAEYEAALQGLTPENGYKISRVGEGMDYMNTIMNISDLSITPDTGLGHFSGAVGTPNVMLTLVDPVQWSTAQTHRVMHPKAFETYKKGLGAYEAMWRQPKDYYVEEDGKKIGASNIAPAQVFEKVEKILG